MGTPGDGGFVGEDADDVGAALDLAVEALDGVGAVQLGTVLLREGHVSEDVGLGLVHEPCQAIDVWAQLVGDAAPLLTGGLSIILRKRRGDEGGDDAATALAGVGQGVAHEVHPAALPGRCEDLRDSRRSIRSPKETAPAGAGGETAALMPSCASEITSFTPRSPRRASWRRKSVQKVSASEAPIDMPSTSRRPSVLTPTAMITATETIRPIWRTFT
jgi:hypothetical protein